MNIIKYTLLIGAAICLFTSCGATYTNTLAADNNIQKLELGMTRQEIITIMGNTYKRLEVKKTANGYQETLGFRDFQDGIYQLRLLDGVLQEWNYLQPYKCKDNCPDK